MRNSLPVLSAVPDWNKATEIWQLFHAEQSAAQMCQGILTQQDGVFPKHNFTSPCLHFFSCLCQKEKGFFLFYKYCCLYHPLLVCLLVKRLSNDNRTKPSYEEVPQWQRLWQSPLSILDFNTTLLRLPLRSKLIFVIQFLLSYQCQTLIPGIIPFSPVFLTSVYLEQAPYTQHWYHSPTVGPKLSQACTSSRVGQRKARLEFEGTKWGWNSKI